MLGSITKERPYSQENPKIWSAQRFHLALVVKDRTGQRIVKLLTLSAEISEIKRHHREEVLEAVPDIVI